MNHQTYSLLQTIKSWGLENHQWDIDEFRGRIDTRDFYGTNGCVILDPGVWITVYEDINEGCPFSGLVKPDFALTCGTEQRILFYKAD